MSIIKNIVKQSFLRVCFLSILCLRIDLFVIEIKIYFLNSTSEEKLRRNKSGYFHFVLKFKYTNKSADLEHFALTTGYKVDESWPARFKLVPLDDISRERSSRGEVRRVPSWEHVGYACH